MIRFTLLFMAIMTITLCSTASMAYAYIGPGAAVAFLGYAFGPVIAIVVSVGLVGAWLGRVVWNKMKVARSDESVKDDNAADE